MSALTWNVNYDIKTCPSPCCLERALNSSRSSGPVVFVADSIYAHYSRAHVSDGPVSALIVPLFSLEIRQHGARHAPASTRQTNMRQDIIVCRGTYQRDVRRDEVNRRSLKCRSNRYCSASPSMTCRRCCPQALALALTLYSQRRGARASGVLWIFWSVLLLCAVPEFYTRLRPAAVEQV